MINPVTIDEKKCWLDGPGRNSYLVGYARANRIFTNTSCLLTAAVLRYRLSGTVDWTYHLSPNEISSHWLVEIQFYEDQDSEEPEHVLIIANGFVIQSMYKQYEWSSEPISKETVELFESGQITGPQLATLTKTDPTMWPLSQYYMRAWSPM
jgi:hypothetical protein